MVFFSNFGEFFFLLGFMVFLISLNHYLSMLLSLEFIMFSLYFCFCVYLSMLNISLEYLFLYFSMMICEGVFGLCVLVSISRFYGNDMFLIKL